MLTIKEAAEILNLSRQRVHVLIQSKRLPAVRKGHQWLLQPSVVKEFNTFPRRTGRPLHYRNPKPFNLDNPLKKHPPEPLASASKKNEQIAEEIEEFQDPEPNIMPIIGRRPPRRFK